MKSVILDDGFVVDVVDGEVDGGMSIPENIDVQRGWKYSPDNNEFYPPSKKSIFVEDGIVTNVIVGEVKGSLPVPEDMDVQPGWTYESGKVAPPVVEIDPQALKRDTLERIDAMAERARLAFVTPGSGQAMVYVEKLSEARRYVSDEKPAADDYPLLQAESDVSGTPLADIARTIIEKQARWIRGAARIERVRLKAKADVKATRTAAKFGAILEALTWPNPEDVQ